MNQRPDQWLRNALRGNAAFSTISGAAFALASTPIATYLGVSPTWLVSATGVGLVGFAAWLVWLASRPEVPATEVKLVIGGDLAWVVLSGLALITGVLRAESTLAVLLVADAVLIFAALQAWGLRRAGRTPLAS
ncbi:MAG: hypothetical protein AAF515_02045 [Pseudomonadota bacterium]